MALTQLLPTRSNDFPSAAAGLNDSNEPLKPVVDIIAIPGIGADPSKTWGDEPWLNRLASDIESVAKTRVFLYDHLHVNEFSVSGGRRVVLQDLHERIGTLGLDEWAARLLGELDRSRSEQRHPRSLIFICHGTGGLILKKALVSKRSAKETRWAALCPLIVFIATPHYGSHTLSTQSPKKRLLVKNGLQLDFQLEGRFQEQLVPWNHTLELLNQQFQFVCRGINVLCYGEQYKTRTFIDTGKSIVHDTQGVEVYSKLIVDENSSEIRKMDHNGIMEGEQWTSLPGNHLAVANLTNFPSEYLDLVQYVRWVLSPDGLKDLEYGQRFLNSIFNDVKIDCIKINTDNSQEEKGAGDAIELNVVQTQESLQSFLQDRLMEPPNAEDLSSRDIYAPRPSLAVIQTEPQVPRVGHSMAENHEAENPKLRQSFMNRTSISQVLVSSVNGLTQSSRASETQRRDSSDTVAGMEPVGTSRSHQRRPPSFRKSFSAVSLPSSLDGDSSKQAGSQVGVMTRSPPGHRALSQMMISKDINLNWFHVPFCVPGWVPPIMMAISQTKDQPDLHKKILQENMWMSNHNPSRHSSPHERYVLPYEELLLPSEVRTDSDIMTAPASATGEAQFAIAFPYLHWDTYKAMKNRYQIIEDRRESEDRDRICTDLLSSRNLDGKIIWHYIDADLPVHTRRTLDQYGYPTLLNTKARDDDQVMYKRTKYQEKTDRDLLSPAGRARAFAAEIREGKAKLRRSKAAKKKANRPPTMLIVDTLWLWILTDDTVLTLAPAKTADNEDPEFMKQADLIEFTKKADLRESLLEEGSINSEKVQDSFDFAAYVVYQCATLMFDVADEPNLKVFQIFEGYISYLVEKQVESFRLFRDEQMNDRASYENKNDLSHLIELRDVGDELQILKKLLEEQLHILEKLITKFQSRANKKARKGRLGTRHLERAEMCLNSNLRQVENMISTCSGAREDYKSLLEMKQAHSSVIEAKRASNQAQVMVVFTVITIIFSPLAFLASIFGMNVSEWTSNDVDPELDYVIRVICGVSIGIIVISLLAAFHRSMMHGLHGIWEVFRVLYLVWSVFGPTFSILRSLVNFNWSKRKKTGKKKKVNTLPADPEKAELVQATSRSLEKPFDRKNSKPD